MTTNLQYKRNLDVIGTAIEDSALYLSTMTGKSMDEARIFVKEYVSKSGKLPVKPKRIKALVRKSNGDRAPASVGLDRLISDAISNDSIIAPNLVSYDNPNVQTACTAKYLERKLALRKVVKRTGHLAEMDGNTALAKASSYKEAGIKLLNNSISGAHASPYTPLYNKTAHSTLTSTCRVMTSYSNASMERFISGNRHYYTYEVAITNILSIVRNTDYNKLLVVVEEYGLAYPTTQQVFDIVKRSTDLYWFDEVKISKLYELINRLTPIQRVAFLYTGDLYSLALLNDKLIRDMLAELIVRHRVSVSLEETDRIVAGASDAVIALVGILCSDVLNGKTVKHLKDTNPEGYRLYGSTIVSFLETYSKFDKLISTLMHTSNLPGMVYNVPSMIRRTVVGSDTDSTMFTVQDWITWYFGEMRFGYDAACIKDTIIYICSGVITNVTRNVSKQLGGLDSQLDTLRMKNEYSFLVYMKANRAKHYATLESAKEGNIYLNPKLDIKGVSLKDSKVPDDIIHSLHKEFQYVMDQIVAGNGVDSEYLMQRIANSEHVILMSLAKGETKYMSAVNINPKTAYVNPMSSNYVHHSLWESVFADTYGTVVAPPYRTVKMSVSLRNALDIKTWIGGFPEDVQVRFTKWHEVVPKNNFTMLLLPQELFQDKVPQEFSAAVDSRRLISELMAGAYILLEICGFYFRNKDNTQYLSDQIPYRPEHGLLGGKK